MADKPLTEELRRSVLSRVLGYVRRFELTSAQLAEYETSLPRLEQQAYQKSQNYKDYIGRICKIRETLKGIKLKPEFANQINMGARQHNENQSQIPQGNQPGSSKMVMNQYNNQQNPTGHQTMRQPPSALNQAGNMQNMINCNNQQPSMRNSQQNMVGNMPQNSQQLQKTSVIINEQQQQDGEMLQQPSSQSYGKQEADVSGHYLQNISQENNPHQQQVQQRQEQSMQRDMMMKPVKQENVSEPHIICQSIGRQPSFISNHLQTNSQSYGRQSPIISEEAFLKQQQQGIKQGMNPHQQNSQEHRVQNNMRQSGNVVPQRTMFHSQALSQSLNNGNLQHSQERRIQGNMTEPTSIVPTNQGQQDLQSIMSQNQVLSQGLNRNQPNHTQNTLSYQGNKSNNVMQQSQLPVPYQNESNPQQQNTGATQNGFNQNANLKQAANTTCIQNPNNLPQSRSVVPQNQGQIMSQNRVHSQGLSGNLQHSQEHGMQSKMTQLSGVVPQNQRQQDLQRIMSQNQVSSQNILSCQGNNAMQQSQLLVPNQNMNNPQLEAVMQSTGTTQPQNFKSGFNQNGTLKQEQFSQQQAANTCIQLPNVQPQNQQKGKRGRKKKVEPSSAPAQDLHSQIASLRPNQQAQKQQRGGGNNNPNNVTQMQENIALELLQPQHRNFKTEQGNRNTAHIHIEQKRESTQKPTTEVIQTDDKSSAQNTNQPNEAQKSAREIEIIEKLTALIIPTPPANKEELDKRLKPFWSLLQSILVYLKNLQKHNSSKPAFLQVYKQKQDVANMFLKQVRELKVPADELARLQNMMLKYFKPFLSRLIVDKNPQPENKDTQLKQTANEPNINKEDSQRHVNQENSTAGNIERNQRVQTIEINKDSQRQAQKENSNGGIHVTGRNQQVQTSVEQVERKLEHPSSSKNEDVVVLSHDQNDCGNQKIDDEGTKKVVLQKSSSHDMGKEAVAVIQEKEKQTLNTAEPGIDNAPEISEKEKQRMNTVEPCIDNVVDISSDLKIEERNKKRLRVEQDIKEEVPPLQRIFNVIQRASPGTLQRMARDWKPIVEKTKNPWYGVPVGSPYEAILIDRYESICKRVKLS